MTNTRTFRRAFLRVGAGAAAGVALSGSGMATFLSKEARAVTSPVGMCGTATFSSTTRTA
jgi:hypothetical protein